MQEGKIDLLCGAATATLSRTQGCRLLDPDLPGRDRSASACGRSSRAAGGPDRKASGVRAALACVTQRRSWSGKTFSVVSGTTSERWLAGRLDKFQITAKVVPVEGYEAGVRRVLDRGADVFFGDRAILLDITMRSPSARDLTILDRQFTYEPIALAFARGDEDFRVVVDRALSRLFGSEEFGDFVREVVRETRSGCAHLLPLERAAGVSKRSK